MSSWDASCLKQIAVQLSSTESWVYFDQHRLGYLWLSSKVWYPAERQLIHQEKSWHLSHSLSSRILAAVSMVWFGKVIMSSMYFFFSSLTLESARLRGQHPVQFDVLGLQWKRMANTQHYSRKALSYVDRFALRKEKANKSEQVLIFQMIANDIQPVIEKAGPSV